MYSDLWGGYPALQSSNPKCHPSDRPQLCQVPLHILEASRIKRTLLLIKTKAVMKSYSQGHATNCVRNHLGHASKLYCPSRMLQSTRRCSSLNQSGARQLPQTLQIRRQRLAKSSAGRPPTVSRQVRNFIGIHKDCSGCMWDPL